MDGFGEGATIVFVLLISTKGWSASSWPEDSGNAGEGVEAADPESENPEDPSEE
jgi:hypothetical protein